LSSPRLSRRVSSDITFAWMSWWSSWLSFAESLMATFGGVASTSTSRDTSSYVYRRPSTRNRPALAALRSGLPQHPHEEPPVDRLPALHGPHERRAGHQVEA
jgi:hypothetical protein